MTNDSIALIALLSIAAALIIQWIGRWLGVLIIIERIFKK